jgi:hypothetical protein
MCELYKYLSELCKDAGLMIRTIVPKRNTILNFIHQ